MTHLLPALLRRHRARSADRERGAVLMLVAVAMPVLLMATSFAIDLGRVRMERRDLQSVADAVALDMVRNLSDHGTAAWTTKAIASAQRNGFTVADLSGVGTPGLTAVPGCYDSATEVFRVLSQGGCVRATAVQAKAIDHIDYRFNPFSGDEGKTTSRSAIASLGGIAQGEFLVGSTVAAVNPASSSLLGGILNEVVPGASLIGYNGLADTDITLQDLAVHLPATVGSPDELLDTTFTFDEIALASAKALQAKGANAAQVQALYDLIALQAPTQEVRLGDAIGANVGGNAGLLTTVDVRQLLVGTAIAIDGDHLIDTNLTTGIPGMATVGIRVEGIEAPQRGGIYEGASATTSQVKLTVTPVIGMSLVTPTQNLCNLPVSERNLIASLLGGVLNLLSCTLTGVLNQVVDVRIDATPSFAVDVAEVTATQHLDCVNKTMTLDTTPSLLRLLSTQTLSIKAKFGSAAPVDLLTLLNQANATATGTQVGADPVFTAQGTGPQYTSFSPTSAQVGSNPLGLKNLLGLTTGDTKLTVATADLTTLAGIVKPLVQVPLNNLLGSLDTNVLDPVAQLLGLNLGGAKLTPLWLQCDENAVQLSG